jgi:hypothetical protein
VTTDGGRVEVRFEDPRAAADPAFLNITAWQGRGLVVDRLERVSEGVYGSTREIPLDGSWKTLVRLQDGRTLVGLPLWAPADAAIPAPEIRVAEGRPQPFVGELEFLQRERKDAAAWLWTTANVVIGLIFLTFFCLLAWGTARVARSAREHDERPAPPAAPAAAPPREPVPA